MDCFRDVRRRDRRDVHEHEGCYRTPVAFWVSKSGRGNTMAAHIPRHRAIGDPETKRKALTWEELESIFDLLRGADNHHLPSFPTIVGAVAASWFDAENIKHQATELGEVEAAYSAQQTARVTFSGWLPNHERWDLSYAPGAPRPRCEAVLTGSPRRSARTHARGHPVRVPRPVRGHADLRFVGR